MLRGNEPINGELVLLVNGRMLGEREVTGGAVAQ